MSFDVILIENASAHKKKQASHWLYARHQLNWENTTPSPTIVGFMCDTCLENALYLFSGSIKANGK